MKIKELELLTNDIEETETFYSQLLSIPVLEKSGDSISFQTGSTRLTFRFSSIKDPVYHIAFDIPNNKLAEAMDWLTSKVSLLPVTPDTNIADIKLWNVRSIYFYDNNQNLLEFICRFDLDNPVETTFTSSQITCVSEIGLVTRDVSGLVEKLTETYQLQIFSKQPAQENFTAIGTDDGLFVVVDHNRNWFPTNRKAAVFPTKIVFENDNEETYEIVLFEDEDSE